MMHHPFVQQNKFRKSESNEVRNFSKNQITGESDEQLTTFDILGPLKGINI